MFLKVKIIKNKIKRGGILTKIWWYATNTLAENIFKGKIIWAKYFESYLWPSNNKNTYKIKIVKQL